MLNENVETNEATQIESSEIAEATYQESEIQKAEDAAPVEPPTENVEQEIKQEPKVKKPVTKKSKEKTVPPTAKTATSKKPAAKTPVKPAAKTVAKEKLVTKAGQNGKAEKPAKPAATPKDSGEKQIRWTTIKLTLLGALKKLQAVNAGAAVLPEDVAKASNGKITEDVVRRQCNNHFDLIVQGIVRKATTPDGVNGIYLTPKGLKALETNSTK